MLKVFKVDPVVDPEGVDYVGLSIGFDEHIVHPNTSTLSMKLNSIFDPSCTKSRTSSNF